REHRLTQPVLDRDTVRIRRDVDDAEAGPEQASRRHERVERGCERRSGQPARRDDQPEPGRPTTATPRGEPAGDRQQQRRDQADTEDDEPELAAVEAEPALQRRQSCGPRAVDGSEGDEREGDRDVRPPKFARPHAASLVCRYSRSTTPAIAWPKPMHIEAIP